MTRTLYFSYQSDFMLHIIDDEEIIRDSLVWLASSNAIRTTSYETSLRFLAELDKGIVFSPEGDCILMDVQMPGASGLDLFAKLAALELTERMPVIFLTGHGEVSMAVDLLKRGAFDFFEKLFDYNKLLARIQEGLAASKKRAIMAKIQARSATLSKREHEVLQLIFNGNVNTKIAGKLNISTRTIEAHRARIFKKMKVKTALELSILLGSNLDADAFLALIDISPNQFIKGCQKQF